MCGIPSLKFGPSDSSRNRVADLCFVDELLDCIIRASLNFRSNNNEPFLFHSSVHLNQMGNCTDAGASPRAPIFDGDDLSRHF
jgi:hypothetical protein